MLEIKQMKRKLQSALSEKRYLHTLGVAATAIELASIYEEDCNKAEIAGLLHDCAKDIPNKIKLSLCYDYHIRVNKIMKDQPDLTHSFLGAEIATKDYGVTDEDILNAIRYHTTGRPKMSELEKIVFIADSIEPNRASYKSLEELKRLAYNDLNKAIVFSLNETLKRIKKKELKLHELTLLALQYYD